MALILYVERLVFPTALLGFTLNTFQLGQVSLDRVEEIFQNNPSIVDGENTNNFRFNDISINPWNCKLIRR